MAGKNLEDIELEVIAGELSDADYEWLADLLVTLAEEEEEQGHE